MNFSPDTVNSVMRHVYTVIGTAGATVITIGLLSDGDVSKLTTGLHQIGDGVMSIVAGIATITPVVSAIYAAISSTRKSRLNALAADPEVKQVVVATPAVANSIPSSKVVSQ